MQKSFWLLAVALAVLLLTLRHQCSSEELFQRCHGNVDCDSDPNAHCRILSPSCGTGTCVCIPGFEAVANASTFVCRRMVAIDQECTHEYDMCQPANAECMDGTCRCRDGFSTGPGGSKVTCTRGTKGVGDDCTEHTDCYSLGNMVCYRGKCTCAGGFREFDKHRCTRITVGEDCQSNYDCQAQKYSICSEEGKCECMKDATRYPVTITLPFDVERPTIERTATGYACFGPGEKPKSEGEGCVPNEEHVSVSDYSFFIVSDGSDSTIRADGRPQRPTLPSTSGNGIRTTTAVANASLFNGILIPTEPTTLPPIKVSHNVLCHSPYHCIYCSLLRPTCARIPLVYKENSAVNKQANGFVVLTFLVLYLLSSPLLFKITD